MVTSLSSAGIEPQCSARRSGQCTPEDTFEAISELFGLLVDDNRRIDSQKIFASLGSSADPPEIGCYGKQITRYLTEVFSTARG